VVRWRPPARAAEQEVVVRSGGARYSADLGRRAHRHRFRDISAAGRLRISVFARNSDGVRGRMLSRTIANSGHVRNATHAVRALVRGAGQTRKGRVVSSAACPRGPAHCTVVLQIRGRSGRLLGLERMVLPPDMTDRIAVAIRGAGARGLRVKGVVRADRQRATAKRRLSLHRR
jgi:hypothetical protein